MKHHLSLLLLVCSLLWAAPAAAMQQRFPAPPGANATAPAKIEAPVKAGSARERVIATAATKIGVTERTGNNDGPEVEAFLRSVGLGKGDPYCAAFVYWTGQQALGSHNPFPKSGYSPDMVQGGGNPELAHAGDTFGIFIPSKNRIGHTGFVVGMPGQPKFAQWYAPPGYARTIEANTGYDAATGTPADANGDGVHSKLRSLKSLRVTRSWLPLN